jgi:hypothetical protein
MKILNTFTKYMKYKSKYIALKQKADDPNYSIIKVNKRINGMCKNTKMNILYYYLKVYINW